eukprot:CAMPEP_0171358662 /NCGR_PEP_ID=MMETSP0879-20121228/132_1 /TAXON_ID=67004 /ORGANISM="Thalassiosira weissflogii, Strain CCMP1336" /LENGTH=593 /DNA_ID=CAMNT_0011864751 /DNA_START=25 /DNA_END=1806 /DNA_ORIENTATION=+
MSRHHHHPHHHHVNLPDRVGDPTLPCSSCHKRHTRVEHDDGSSVGETPEWRFRVRRNPISLGSVVLAIFAFASASAPASATSPLLVVRDHVAVAEDASSEGKATMGVFGELGKKIRDGDAETTSGAFSMDASVMFWKGRFLQEDEEQVHEHENEDESHEDEALVEDEAHDDHAQDDHLHEDEALVDEDHDDHDGHDHGESDSITSESNEASTSAEKPWGRVIGAALLVNLASLTGILLLLLPAMRIGYLKYKGGDTSKVKENFLQGKFLNLCVPAFAVGALIATAVFLVFPEAVYLIGGSHSVAEEDEDSHAGHDHRRRNLQEGDGHDDHGGESLAAARFGMAVMGGYLLPVFFAVFFAHNHEAPSPLHAPPTATPNDPVKSIALSDEECASCKGDVETDADIAVTVAVDSVTGTQHVSQSNDDRDPTSAETLRPQTQVDKRLCSAILIGDSFHNFADGIFIGASFLSCSSATAISIVLATLFHEMAQELADFILLTQHAGLSIVKGAVLNFASGLFVALGGVLVLASEPSDITIGVILAIAGGVYLNVAATETFPRIERKLDNVKDRLLVIFMFAVGATPIGLVLLDHKHCA